MAIIALKIFLLIVILYFIAVFFLARFFIPHIGFKLEDFPEKLPVDMEKKIIEFKTRANSPYEFLELSYNFLGSRYQTGRFMTVIKFDYLFKSIEEIWQLEGFAPCSQSNYLLKIFLVRSGFFKENEIKTKHTFLNFFLHQYLIIKINNHWIDVDVGEAHRGMLLGKHLRFFG